MASSPSLARRTAWRTVSVAFPASVRWEGGGAIEELAAEGLFELAHLLAPSTDLLETELAGGAGEGARLHHGDEGREQGEGFLVHVVLDMEIMLFQEGRLSPYQNNLPCSSVQSKEQPHDPRF